MSRVVLRQFGLAVAIVIAYVLLMSTRSFLAHPEYAERAGGFWTALALAIPNAVLFGAQMAVGVSLSLLPIRAGAFRTALWVGGGVTAALVVNDLVARDFWNAIEARSMGSEVGEGYVPRFDDTTSTLGGTLAHLMGKVRPEDIQPWPPNDGSDSRMFATIRDPKVILRVSAVQKYATALTMLIPAIAAGLVLGLGAWLSRVASFRASRDERLLRLGAGWVISILSMYGLTQLAMGSLYELSSPSGSLAWMAAPYLLAMIPAFLGWRAVWRLDRLAGE